MTRAAVNAPRRAVVTGASSGVGAAVARAFGALGWQVAIGARRTDRLREVAERVEASGGRALVEHLDVTSAESIDRFFAAAEKAFGALDLVVSNAGLGIPGLLHELPVEDIEREISTNLLGPILVARRALPSLIEHRGGDLVFVSSMTVVEPRPFQATYAAAKAGIEAMARTLKQDLEGTGVRTTVVRLGPTRSEFGFGWDQEILLRVIETWERWGFMRHPDMLEPEDVAEAIVNVLTTSPRSAWDVIQLNPAAPKTSP